MSRISSHDWVKAFNDKLRVKPFEQFSLLLCDLDSCESAQKDLLKKILFDDHASPVYWGEYISYAFKKFPERKLQLQRLVNKALETVDEKENKNNRHFAAIHVQSAKLKT